MTDIKINHLVTRISDGKRGKVIGRAEIDMGKAIKSGTMKINKGDLLVKFDDGTIDYVRPDELERRYKDG